MTETEYRKKASGVLPCLLQKIGSITLPLVIAVRPEADAKINSCFYNVERKVKRDGGTACYGWAIRFSYYIIEAEKHAIWKSNNAEYIDVTPNVLGQESTYFVIDSDFRYSGQLIDNVRVNVTGEKIVDDWIAVSETIHALYTHGQRIGEHEIKIPENVAQAIQSLEQYVVAFPQFLAANGSYNTQCFCGRTLTYSECHGLDLKDNLKEIVAKAAIVGDEKHAIKNPDLDEITKTGSTTYI